MSVFSNGVELLSFVKKYSQWCFRTLTIRCGAPWDFPFQTKNRNMLESNREFVETRKKHRGLMNDTHDKTDALGIALDQVSQLLDHMKKANTGVAISPEVMHRLQSGKPTRPLVTAVEAVKSAASVEPVASAQIVESKECGNLEEVRHWLGDCTRCRLSEKRTKIVFGSGNPNAELMFIGEGPGRDEDLQGEPFVGKAGQMLTKMIEGGYKKTREDVYIANVVKCRPPGNRDPQPDEVCACAPFLGEQVRLIKPRVICTLGRVATQALLDSTEPISRMRGKWHDYRGIKVAPTYHPAALLRNPANKRPAWEDIKLILKELGW